MSWKGMTYNLRFIHRVLAHFSVNSVRRWKYALEFINFYWSFVSSGTLLLFCNSFFVAVFFAVQKVWSIRNSSMEWNYFSMSNFLLFTCIFYKIFCFSWIHTSKFECFTKTSKRKIIKNKKCSFRYDFKPIVVGTITTEVRW